MALLALLNSVCRSASLALQNIGKVRKYLNQSATERLVHAFITSKLDYCNSLLFGLPATELQKLQRIQNSDARLVIRSKRSDHITPILRDLHWLPVIARISFKVLLLTYKAMNGFAPSYLTSLLIPYIPRRNLRSASKGLLVVPCSVSCTYKDRAFSVIAPKLWNSLPYNIRNAKSVSKFKSHCL